MSEAKLLGATLVVAPVSTGIPQVAAALLEAKLFSMAMVNTGAEYTGCVEA